MKGWLIFGALVAFAAFGNATSPSDPPTSAPRSQPATKEKPALPLQQPERSAVQPTAVRHLTDQERAELRRQLQQFNQQYTRRQ